MKRFIHSLSILSIAFLLTACSSFSKKADKEVVFNNTKYVLLVPPQELLTACPVPEHFDFNEYLKATPDKKEQMFTELVVELYKQNAYCNIQINALRSWFQKQESKIKDGKDG